MSIETTSLSALRQALSNLGISTATPGLRGEERRMLLQSRFNEACQDWHGESDEQPAMSCASSNEQPTTEKSSSQDLERMSMSELKRALEEHQLETTTPGLKGSDRQQTLMRRLSRALFHQPSVSREESLEESVIHPPPSSSFIFIPPQSQSQSSGFRYDDRPKTDDDPTKTADPLVSSSFTAEERLRSQERPRFQLEFTKLRQPQYSFDSTSSQDLTFSTEHTHRSDAESLQDQLRQIQYERNELFQTLSCSKIHEATDSDSRLSLSRLPITSNLIHRYANNGMDRREEKEGQRPLAQMNSHLQDLMPILQTMETQLERQLISLSMAATGGRPVRTAEAWKTHLNNNNNNANPPPPLKPQTVKAPVLLSRADQLGRRAYLYQHLEHNDVAAEATYLRALACDPDHVLNLGNYALFLQLHKHAHDAAEEMFERAIAQASSSSSSTITTSRRETSSLRQVVTNVSNYANFLKRVRQMHDKAEIWYQRGQALDPTHEDNLGNYATFLRYIRHDHEAAKDLYLQALTFDPEHGNNLAQLASLLDKMGKKEEAEVYYQRAITVDGPSQPLLLGNYANMLKRQHKLHQAKEWYLKALGMNRKHPILVRNYGIFLRDHPSMRSSGISKTIHGNPKLRRKFLREQSKHGLSVIHEITSSRLSSLSSRSRASSSASSSRVL